MTTNTTRAASMLLNHYAALEFASDEMLAAAHAGDWECVSRLESACAVVLTRLQQLDLTVALTEEESRQRSRILETILSNDLEICRLCQRTPLLLETQALPVIPAGQHLH